MNNSQTNMSTQTVTPSVSNTPATSGKYKPNPTSARERIAAKIAKTKGVGVRARRVMSR